MSEIQTQIISSSPTNVAQAQKKVVVSFETRGRRRPYYVNGNRYDRYFALVPARSDAELIINHVIDSVKDKVLRDVRIVDGSTIIFLPSVPLHVERIKKDGTRNFRFALPADVGRQIAGKEIFVYAYVGEGDNSVLRLDSRTYNAVAVFETTFVYNGSIIASVPVKFSDLIPVEPDRKLEVDVVSNDAIKTVYAVPYYNGYYKDKPRIALRFEKNDVIDLLGKKAVLVVKVQ